MWRRSPFLSIWLITDLDAGYHARSGVIRTFCGAKNGLLPRGKLQRQLRDENLLRLRSSLTAAFPSSLFSNRLKFPHTVDRPRRITEGFSEVADPSLWYCAYIASTHHAFGSLPNYLGHISGHSKRKWLIFNSCPTWIRTMNKAQRLILYKDE
jgi:hypothetical protein